MDIEYSIQKLFPLKKLNRFSKVEDPRDILYLKINDKYFIEYHPWAEFGDISIYEYLDQIKKNNDLSSKAKELLQIEIEKDKIECKSLKNNFLLVEYEQNLSQKDIPVKVKYSSFDIIDDLLSKGTRVRIDFNGKVPKGKLENWLNGQSKDRLALVDYFEDPGADPILLRSINSYGIKIARDRLHIPTEYINYNIVKPNVDLFEKCNFNHSILSSYMGGDLGRYHCYLIYCKFGNKNLFHGIHTPCLYEKQIEFLTGPFNNLNINQSAIQYIYSYLRSLSWTKV